MQFIANLHRAKFFCAISKKYAKPLETYVFLWYNVNCPKVLIKFHAEYWLIFALKVGFFPCGARIMVPRQITLKEDFKKCL